MTSLEGGARREPLIVPYGDELPLTPAEDGSLPGRAPRRGAPSGCASTPSWTAAQLALLNTSPYVRMTFSARYAPAVNRPGRPRKAAPGARSSPSSASSADLGVGGVALRLGPGRRAPRPLRATWAASAARRRAGAAGDHRGARRGRAGRARISGSVTVPSSRSVPSGLPVVSRVAVAVENVVGDLEGQAQRLGELARAAPGRRRAARRGGRPASRPRRTARRSSGGSAPGTARRWCRRVAGLRALQDLAAGEGEAGVGEQRHRRHVAGLAPARRTPARTGGRRWPSRPLAVARATRSAVPRRSGARSSWSSCTSVAMCTSSTAQPAITSSRRSRAAGGADR